MSETQKQRKKDLFRIERVNYSYR